MSGMATCCVVGLLGTSQNIWRLSLIRRSWEASRNWCAGSQVSPDPATAPFLLIWQGSLEILIGWMCFFVCRESYHHTKENPSQSVVSWSLDFGLLLLPCKRLFGAGRGKLDGAPAYKQIAGTSTSKINISKYLHTHVVQLAEVLSSHLSCGLT